MDRCSKKERFKKKEKKHRRRDVVIKEERRKVVGRERKDGGMKNEGLEKRKGLGKGMNGWMEGLMDG